MTTINIEKILNLLDELARNQREYFEKSAKTQLAIIELIREQIEK